MFELNMYDLTVEKFGKFDVIVFPGVLYHLRYLFWGLKVLRDLINPNGILIVETAIFYGATERPMVYCPIGSESQYEPTSCTFFNKKGLTDSLSTLGWKTLSTSVLRPDLEVRSHKRTEPILDREVFVCQYAGLQGNELVDQYWHGVHDVHAQFAADTRRALDSGRFEWESESKDK